MISYFSFFTYEELEVQTPEYFADPPLRLPGFQHVEKPSNQRDPSRKCSFILPFLWFLVEHGPIVKDHVNVLERPINFFSMGCSE